MVGENVKLNEYETKLERIETKLAYMSGVYIHHNERSRNTYTNNFFPGCHGLRIKFSSLFYIKDYNIVVDFSPVNESHAVVVVTSLTVITVKIPYMEGRMFELLKTFRSASNLW